MQMSEEELDYVLQALSHRVRRRILRMLIEEKPSYTVILKKLELTTGTLNYHLEKMRRLYRVESSRYVPTELGLKAYQMVYGGRPRAAAGRDALLSLIRIDQLARQASLGSYLHMAASAAVGSAAALLAWASGCKPASLALNCVLPLLFTLAAAKGLYRLKAGRLVPVYPAVLQPLAAQAAYPIIRRHVLSASTRPELAALALEYIWPKLVFIWFFALLLIAVRESLQVDYSRAFVSAAVGVVASRLVLQLLDQATLLLG